MDAQDVNNNEQSANAKDRAGGASDKGPTRSENQDAYWIPDLETKTELGALYLVADGVGGQESGAEAAQLAVQAVRETFYELRSNGEAVRDALRDALQHANQVVFDEAQRKEIRRMGATFVAAVVDQGELTIAHVGDARAYLLRQEDFRQLTRDDTWVQKQVEEGFLTAEQAAKHEFRNIVTQVLGNKPDVNVHLSQAHTLQRDDVILLCSDGLYDVVPENEMVPFLRDELPQQAAVQLVQAAIDAEASDNITAVVVQPGVAASTVDAPTVAVAAAAVPSMAEQPTMPLPLADEPTIPPSLKIADAPPPAPKSKSKTPFWLIILAIVAVLIILAVILVFWQRSSDLEASVETAAEIDLTSTALVASPTSGSAGALRAVSTTEAENNEAEIIPTATAPATEVPTDVPVPTPTLQPTPTIEATAEPRGCVNDSVIAYVWDQSQLDAGDCVNTQFQLEVGDEVRILEETAVTAGGTCAGVQFIKVQSLSDDELEGWVSQNAIIKIAVGASCNP